MAVDPTGLTPGVVAPEPAKKIVNIKCRNPQCNSIQCEVVYIVESQGIRLYKCVKCGQHVPVSVGGAF
jgi:hypothetical protein